MASGQTRLARRFYDEKPALEAVRRRRSARLSTRPRPKNSGLVTSAPDDIDWADEVRLAIEERVVDEPRRA